MDFKIKNTTKNQECLIVRNFNSTFIEIWFREIEAEISVISNGNVVREMGAYGL
jgi:hypothetical protein